MATFYARDGVLGSFGPYGIKDPPRVSNEELWRLRRFALVLSMILLTYAVAAVGLDPEAKVSPLGVPLRIQNPELLGVGLAAAVLSGVVRFAYYGLMLSESPAVRRARELRAMKIGADYKAVGVFNVSDQNKDSIIEQFQESFPRIPGARIDVALSYPDETARDVQETLEGTVVARVSHLEVPITVRLAMFVEQVDYTSPVWFGALSLGSWFWRLFVDWTA